MFSCSQRCDVPAPSKFGGFGTPRSSPLYEAIYRHGVTVRGLTSKRLGRWLISHCFSHVTVPAPRHPGRARLFPELGLSPRSRLERRPTGRNRGDELTNSHSFWVVGQGDGPLGTSIYTLGVKSTIKRMVFRGPERELPLLQPVKI